MYQVVETTYKQKIKMYKKSKKKELIKMLIESNRLLQYVLDKNKI